MLKSLFVYFFYGFFLLFGIVIFSSHVSAISPTKSQETHQEELRKELSVNLPIRTNDPSYSITFVPPNTKAETSIQVDEKIFQNVKSPFVLPALSIGEHTITFKYRSKKGALKILLETILITPKPPIFDADIPVEGKIDQKVSLHGISIPSSIINVIHNSQTVITTKADDTGKWKLESSPLILGRNTFIAQVDKNGYISNFSKSIALNVGTQSLITDTFINNTVTTKKSFTNYWQNLLTWIKNNQDQAIVLGGALGLIIITIILFRLFIGTKRRKRDRTIRDILKNTRSSAQNFTEQLSEKILPKKEKKKIIKPLLPTKQKEIPKKVSVKKPSTKKVTPKVSKTDGKARLQQSKSKISIIFKKKRSSKNSTAKVSIEKNVTKSLTKEEFLKKFKQS